MKEKLPYAKPEFQVYYLTHEYGVAVGSIPHSQDDIELSVDEWKLEDSFEKELEF